MPLTQRPKLTQDKFNEILRGAYRDHAAYSSTYNYTSEGHQEITLSGFDIEGNEEGQLAFLNALKPLVLILKDCQLPDIVTQIELHALICKDCTVERMDLRNGKTVQFYFSGKKGKMKECLITQGNVWNIQLDTKVGLLQIEPSSTQLAIQGQLSGNIEELRLDGITNSKFQCDAVIRRCVIIRSTYPFQNKVRICTLVISDMWESLLSLSGLFEEIYLKKLHGSIHLVDLICLGDVTIEEQSSVASPEIIFTEISNVYIAGKLTLRDSDVVFRSKLDGIDNDMVYVNQLEIINGLKWVDIRTPDLDHAVWINEVSFTNIQFAKDTYWAFQGLIGHRIIFNNFKNAGNGDIATLYGGGFKPIERKFEELITIIMEEKAIQTILNEIEDTDVDLSKQPGRLEMNYSDLGKINFIDVNLSKFILYFFSTKLSEIYLAGTRFPAEIKASHMGGPPEPLRQQERIANSQLKKLHEQHGDILAANDYFAGEMNAYDATLSWRKNFWEKLPLFFNRISSNHGQSWHRAFACLLVISICFYILFVISAGNYPASPFNQEARRIFTIASMHLEFLNIIRKLDDFQSLYSKSASDLLLCIVDDIGRVFISYCVYNSYKPSANTGVPNKVWIGKTNHVSK